MTTVATVVTVACVVGAVVMFRQLRRWDREEADRNAAAVIDAAERVVRVAESRRRHPSARGDA